MTQQTPYQPPVVNPRPQSRSRGSSIPLIALIVTPLICLVIGTAAGALSRSFRNDMSGVHYEAIIELGVKVLVNVAVLIACFLIPKTWIRILNYIVANVAAMGVINHRLDRHEWRDVSTALGS